MHGTATSRWKQPVTNKDSSPLAFETLSEDLVVERYASQEFSPQDAS
jgi:hypothetical protein